MFMKYRSLLIWFLTLAITACQMMPPGTRDQPALTGGFQIQGKSKPELKPILSCVSQSRNGSLLAHFSYANSQGKTVTLPVGGQNKFLENPGWGNNPQKHPQDKQNEKDRNSYSNRRDYQDRGQITTFPPGVSPAWPQSAFSVAFTQERLTWQLGTHSVTAYAADLSQRCKEEKITVAAHTAPRKTLRQDQIVTLTQTQQVFNFVFQASDLSDLRRRIAINLINGPDGSSRVDDLRIYVNKQPLLAQRPEASFLKAEVPNMITEIFNTQFGNNTLELELSGPVGAQVRFSIEGFLRTAFIPGAAHSAINEHAHIRKAPIYNGVVGIKFMEGMKVRLGQATSQWERLSDDTGVSLMPLRALIAYQQISDIVPALPGSVQERDAMEQRTESETGHEAPNQNLFYYLHFDEGKDVWEMVDRLSTLPFIEEAFPMFVFASPQATAPPTLVPFVPEEVKPSGGLFGFDQPDPTKTPIPHSLWLKSTRILNQNAGLPSPLPSPAPSATSLAGAWDFTQGSTSVKVAAIEHGFNRSHEDLGGIQQLLNMSPGASYTDFGHATQTMGVLGATKDPSGKGSIGVAHGASVYHIWAWDNQLHSPSLCKGTGTATCNPTVDALTYAQKENMKAVLVEVEGRGFIPGTVEEYDPPVRVHIRQTMTLANMTIILPAGNRACAGMAQSDFDLCKALFKNGKNIKAITVSEPIWDMRGCELPNPTISWIPLFGPIIAAVLSLNLGTCLTTTPPIKGYKFSFTGPMEDTGAIIVGALKVDGTAMVPPDAAGTHILPFNHGKSIASSDGLETVGGHGTDISGPSEYIYTTTYDPNSNSSYGNYGGTSGASAVIAGVVALMLSAKPTITPKEIRKILRETEQPLPSGEDISGMVNAYEAVKKAGGFTTSSFTRNHIAATAPAEVPPGVTFVLTSASQGQPIFSDQKGVVYINNQDLTGAKIIIDGQEMPIEVFADNYLVFGLKPELTPGLKDVLIQLAGGSVTLQQALEILAPCGTDEIVTNPGWIWFQNNQAKPAVIVPFYDTPEKVKITANPLLVRNPHQGDKQVHAIWSEIFPVGHPYAGTAVCGPCNYDFWFDYVLPNGYQVRSAKVQIQSDDAASIFVNLNYIGSSTYASTFGSNTYQELNVPPAVFQTGGNTVGLAFSLRGENGNQQPFPQFNYAALAGKMIIERCH